MTSRYTSRDYLFRHNEVNVNRFRYWVPTLFVVAIFGTAPCMAKDWVIHAGTLLDGSSATPHEQVSILVHDDKITTVVSGFVSPAGAEIIDLSGATVMPGFIDCHVHVSAMLPGRGNATEYRLTHDDIGRAFDAAVFARQMLQQGFTSARDVGGGDETVALRNAIDDGSPRALGFGSHWSHWDPPQDTAIPRAAWMQACRTPVGTTVSSIPPSRHALESVSTSSEALI